jgi:5-methylcytosine-specific restriction endonuclease McrA
MNDEALYLTFTDPEQAKRLIGEKNCRRCGALKPLSEFPRNRGFADGRHTQCSSCNRERALAWAAANRERSREKAREWYSKNPERAKANVAAWQAKNGEKKRSAEAEWKRKNAVRVRLHNAERRALKRVAGGGLSPDIVQQLMEKQRGKCPCCGKSLGRDFHLDHITPLIDGGAHADANMQLLRARCNLQKNRKDPIQFMQERGFLL